MSDPMELYERLLHRDVSFRFFCTIVEDDLSPRITGGGSHWHEVNKKVWKLFDRRGNLHTVNYLTYHNPPLLTSGWSKIRKFYGLEGPFIVWFRYIMNAHYLISIHDESGNEIHYPRPVQAINSCPDVHSGHPANNEQDVPAPQQIPSALPSNVPVEIPNPLPAVEYASNVQNVQQEIPIPHSGIQFQRQFPVTLTTAKLKAYHLDIPANVSPFITENGAGPWTFVGPTGRRILCSVIVPKDRNRTNKFGSGWKDFCASHSLKQDQSLMVKLTDAITREAHIFIE